MRLQRIAIACSHAGTMWAPRTLFVGTTIGGHLVKVQLSFRALVADPMHQLSAAKGDVIRVNAFFWVALIVPFEQQRVLHCFKCWLLVFVSNTRCSAASRTSTVILHTFANYSLPLMAADWTLPLSSEATASQRLFRCLGILVKVPVLCLSWCLGSNRVVLTDSFPLAVWAFGASCAVTHTCLPDMRASCWTVGARPHDFQVAVWLDLDAAK